MRFSDASSRLPVAGADFSFNQSVLYRSTEVVVMSIAFLPPNAASRRGSRVVFRSPRLLRLLLV
jgi:hypothetical protein